MGLIREMVPEFERAWQAHLEFWGDEEAGLSNDLAEFSAFFVSDIESISEEKRKDIFLLIEQCLEEGDDSVKDAVATCFLENLLNAVSGEAMLPESFVQYLGSKSREFCKSWDQFTGIQTPGL